MAETMESHEISALPLIGLAVLGDAHRFAITPCPHKPQKLVPPVNLCLADSRADSSGRGGNSSDSIKALLLLQYLYLTTSLLQALFPSCCSTSLASLTAKSDPLLKSFQFKSYQSWPYGFFPILQLYVSILTRVVSPDTTITIVFGLIGVILSLVGVIIACLTLRFMILEKCMLPVSFSPPPPPLSSQLVSVLTSYVIQDERHRQMDRDYCERVLRHEHTHLFPLPQGQGASQRTLKPV
ncbi:hypothetical protein NA56DRAFT_706513 [Hyaloscypha hepaticicola]|uniref:Uncharacterized protein n=1 Tax=Hyaloscypha hepaticicola TaxID=2082293 RepID=A0A2J6PX39_9HELO|nr:hypothetical protein NA56DRAFT_706513 [Hyaloscypha hepaticicola]